jgi:CRISPR/Cas system CMR-associated protein Cmr1 (group 7 of RAMP superfamily)
MKNKENDKMKLKIKLKRNNYLKDENSPVYKKYKYFINISKSIQLYQNC